MAKIQATRRTLPAQASTQHSAFSNQPHTNKKRKAPTAPARRRRRGRQFHRFREAVGKTVEFVEMYTSADFPCVEIGFTDKTALHFLIETRLAMEPTYSDWTTGDQRLLREWPPRETS